MKWIGQHIYDLVSKFRNDVYLEGLPTTTETNVLVVDSDGKVSKSTTVAGDITSIDAGTGLSGTSLTGPIPTINIDAAQPTVTSLGTLTSLTVSGNLNVGGYIHPNDETGNLSIYGGNNTTNDAHILLHGNSNYWGSLELNYGYDATNSFFKISQGSSEHLRITNGGNVGIGTTSPSELLNISSGAATHAKILIDAGADADLILDKGAGSRRSHIDYKIAGTTKWYAGTADSDVVGSGDDYFIGTTVGGSNAEFFLKRSNGYVGIGTTSPTHKLDVIDSTSTYVARFRGSASTYVQSGESDLSGESGFVAKNSTGAFYLGVTGGVAYLTGTSGANTMTLGVGGAEKMRITSAGNVGIGTTSPSEKLHVVGDALITGDSLADAFKPAAAGEPIKFKNFGGTERARILDGGNVGIGTSSPSKLLHISQTADSSGIRVTGHDNENNSHLDLYVDNFGSDYITSTEFLGIHSGGSARLRSAGYLRLESVNQNNQIQVDSGYIKMTTSGAEAMRIDTSGNVGIGITAPTQALHLPDSKQIALGTGADLKIQHNGTNSEIGNSTGSLNIYNHADNSDINFMADDNSGGLLTYFFLDGSAKTLEYRVPLNIGVNDAGHDVKFYGATSGRYLLWDESEDTLRLQDTTQLKFGDGGDMSIYHTSGQNWIDAYSGQLNIRQLDNDADIVFQSDDGSGGVATYFYLDGSIVENRFAKATRHSDNIIAKFGDGNDLNIYSDGTNGIISTETDDGDLILKCDDGSGGTTAYLTLDGSAGTVEIAKDTNVSGNVTATRLVSNIIREGNGNGHLTTTVTNASNTATVVGNNATCNTLTLGAKSGGSVTTQANVSITGTLTVGADAAGHDVTFFGANSGRDMVWDTSSNALHIKDSAILKIGTGGDLQIKHNGSNNVFTNLNGHLEFINYGDNTDIKFTSDDGSGGTTEYLKLDGGYSSPQIIVPDNVAFNVGSGLDFNIIHNGSNTTLTNNTGNLTITNNTDDGDIIFQSDNGSGGVTTYFQLDGSAGLTTVSKNMKFFDNIPAVFGTGADSYVRHTGSNMEITNTAGNIVIDSATNDGDIIFKGTDGGADITALTLDMSAAGQANFNSHVYLPDAAKIKLGAGHDLQIWHESNHSYIANATGNLTITNNTDDGDIIFQSDDGSGGVKTYMSLDGGWGVVNIPDSVELTLGTGRDLRLIHDGTDSKIYNYGGHLKIVNNTDDKDILFQCDDGSGGVATYFYLDGSLASSGYYYTRFPDQSILSIGDSNDLQIMHAGGNSLVRNFVGDLYFSQYADDKDIIFYCDDGSGGVTPYLTLDGGLGYMVAQKGVKHEGFLWLPDNKTLYIGSGNDLRIHHNGSDSYISQEGTGSLIIRNTTNDEDIIFQCDDGSGGTATYLTLDGGLGYMTAAKSLRFLDSTSAYFGASNDLTIQHDGSNSYINNGTGDLYIRQNTDNKDIIFQSDDGSGGVTEYFRLDGGAVGSYFSKHVHFGDSVQLRIGAGNDFYMLHDGSDTYASNETGDLYIQNAANDKDIIFRCDDGSGGNTAYLTLDGSAETVEVAKEMNLAVPLATDQQKHLAYFEFKGYGTSDGTNYEMPEVISDTNAPFEHNTSTGSDGLTAQEVTTVMRQGGVVMPRTGVLKKFTGWVTTQGTGTVDIGIFKFTPVDNDAGDVAPVLLVIQRITGAGNTKMRSFSEEGSFDAGFTAGDIIYSAVLGATADKSWYLNSTLEVEWS